MIKKLAPYTKGYRLLMLFAIACSAGEAVLELTLPQVMSDIVDIGIANGDRGYILMAGLKMVIMALLALGCGVGAAALAAKASMGFGAALRKAEYEQVQRFSFANIERFSTASLVTRLTNDVASVQMTTFMGMRMLVRAPTMLVTALVMALIISQRLSQVFLVVIPLLIIAVVIVIKRVGPFFTSLQGATDQLNLVVQEDLNAIRVVKSFGNEKREIEKFRKGNERFVDAKRVTYRYMAGYHAGMDAFTTLITVAALVSGAMFLASGSISATDLVTFLLYINNFTEPVTKLVNFTEQFQNGYSGYDRFLEMMSIAPDIEDAPDAVPLDHVDGDIRFENVSFHYEDHDDKVLSNVNLEVKPGDYVALVGTSGAGKTTLCSLIPRFYDVTEGAIYLDGKDIRKIKLKDLRQQIGIVQQDVYLFAGNIMENIRYGRPDATDEEVIRAAKLANAHDFIMEMPDNYATDIGQRGVKLSGGQKQRLSIARAFLKNPPILIFDEATSALDNESEKVVQESLERLAKNRTTFVIAHRLSTIRNARRILVLTEDGIAEEGTHQELMEKDGVYAKLCKAGL